MELETEEWVTELEKLKEDETNFFNTQYLVNSINFIEIIINADKVQFFQVEKKKLLTPGILTQDEVQNYKKKNLKNYNLVLFKKIPNENDLEDKKLYSLETQNNIILPKLPKHLYDLCNIYLIYVPNKHKKLTKKKFLLNNSFKKTRKTKYKSI